MSMEHFADGTLIGFGSLWLLGFFAFGFLSHREHVPRTAWISFAIGTLLALPAFLALLLPTLVKAALALFILVLLLVFSILVLYSPTGAQENPSQRRERYDERDVVFSRARLTPGKPEYDQYYAMRPKNLAIDEKFRAQPGLLSLDALKAEPLTFAASESSFDLTEYVREAVDGPVSPQVTRASSDMITHMIKGFALHLGAHSVGVTELDPTHVYSHIGRGTGTYGDPIVLDHRYAIAFCVEMDYDMMGRAPDAPVVLESARKYVDAAVIAIQIATLCRRLGYPARAHIDGNYRVIVPLVARDAGLGEIGRIGILMTPRLGPRVRLGVVTTNLPLVTDNGEGDSSIISFCKICNKCAENCPSKAIPFGDREGEPGSQRWKLDEIRCFTYWNVIGTDCGLCMAVCPFSHPNNWAHNLVRAMIDRSPFSRRVALWLEDLFYAPKPAPRPHPDWLPLTSEQE
jgi:ferredoxin